MQITNTDLRLVPPEHPRQHDDTESCCHYRVTLRNHTDRVETVRIVYSLLNDHGRAEHEEIALAIEPNTSLDWDAWLSLWSRFEQPETVGLIARMNVNGREHEVTDSFEIEAGDRPRTYDPARQNMPSGGSLRGEV
jgi:hypothetical protein